MRRVARARPIGAACLGALLALSMAAAAASPVAADSGACVVGASADSLRPNTLSVMFAGCAYVVSDAAPPYTIDLVGPGYTRRLYQGDGDAPNTTSGFVTWTISGLPAGTYQIVSTGIVGFDADGNPTIGTGSLSIRVFDAEGTTLTPTPLPATPTPHPTVTPSPTRTPRPTPSPTAGPARTPSPTPSVVARATTAAAPRHAATAHRVPTPATTASASPTVAVATALAPVTEVSPSSPVASSGPALPRMDASALTAVTRTPAPPQASRVAALAPGVHGPGDEETVMPAGISAADRSSAVTGDTMRLVLVQVGGLVALAVVLVAILSRRRRTAR